MIRQKHLEYLNQITDLFLLVIEEKKVSQEGKVYIQLPHLLVHAET